MTLGVVGFGLVELVPPPPAGEKLTWRKAAPTCRRSGRPISGSAVPLSPGIEKWRLCPALGVPGASWQNWLADARVGNSMAMDFPLP